MKDEWLYCLHCGKVSRSREKISRGGSDYCPYSGCDGGANIDRIPWATIRKQNPSYPETPERNVFYKTFSDLHKSHYTTCELGGVRRRLMGRSPGNHSSQSVL
jgi:hypothetical protein